MRRRIDAKRDALTLKDRQSVDRVRQLQVDKPFGADALPEFVKDQSGRRRTPRYIRIVLARGPKANYKNAKRIRNAFFDLSVTEEQFLPQPIIMLPAIIDAIADDGPMVISGAILVMVVAAWL